MSESQRNYSIPAQYSDFVKNLLDGCRNGHREVVELSYKIFCNHKLDMNSILEDAFISLCENGHKEIAEWLYNQCSKNLGKRKIESLILKSFCCSCKSGYKNVAEWLYELSKDDNIKLNNLGLV